MVNVSGRIRRFPAAAKKKSSLTEALSTISTLKGENQERWISSSCSSSCTEDVNPYSYTSGRWLHKEGDRFGTRNLQFDFQALLKVAISTRSRARSVKRFEKQEGGFNRAFILHLDDDSKVVARVPFKHAGAPRLRTSSEVATIAYVQKTTNIPVPTILAWSDDPTNTVGSEYIIMEHVSGLQLHSHWPEINGRQHLEIIRKLVEYMRELSKLSFPAFGCIYFNDAPLAKHEKVDIGDGFVIGPNCHPEYWSLAPDSLRNYRQRQPNHGPWADLAMYVQGLLDNGYSRLPDSMPNSLPEFHGSIHDHIKLLEASKSVLDKLTNVPRIQNISEPLLLHPDLHKRNIFISESTLEITGLIDWQFAAINPTFTYAQDAPDFLFLHDHIENLVSKELGESADAATREERTKKILERVELYQKMYTTCLRGWIPNLWQARQTKETLLRFFQYCGTSWRDSAPALRQALIELSRDWETIGLPGHCPYQPNDEDLSRHAAQYADFEHAMDAKHVLMETIRCDADGWVNNEAWELAKDLCHEVYLKYLETVKEDDDLNMSEEKAVRLWPFDRR